MMVQVDRHPSASNRSNGCDASGCSLNTDEGDCRGSFGPLTMMMMVLVLFCKDVILSSSHVVVVVVVDRLSLRLFRFLFVRSCS